MAWGKVRLLATSPFLRRNRLPVRSFIQPDSGHRLRELPRSALPVPLAARGDPLESKRYGWSPALLWLAPPLATIGSAVDISPLPWVSPGCSDLLLKSVEVGGPYCSKGPSGLVMG